ncbi:Protein UNUSUAL FLORAL ORGANS [Hibiscus syriacus]|uniref:Protein UNUSUAL FLORAL ORGANS n=1 Tax=Hibiscus syriacus TaxID=106335 RepID=A0A6A2Z912_HIBSY|nr:Protein UNUSUAL FLORAL ORGANS [Hibiscus syriacus]
MFSWTLSTHQRLTFLLHLHHHEQQFDHQQHHTSPRMDVRIWSKLPETLLDRVIAFLPPPAFFRARCVCKRWYGLLYCSSFLELTKSTASEEDDNRSNCEGYLFDPYGISWYRISFNSVPSGFYPASSCGPRLFPSIGLTVSPTSIDVTVAGDDMISPYAVKNLSTETFHIDACGFYSIWGDTSSLPRLCSLESGRMVHVEGKFYCMNYSPFSVLAYDIAANKWSKIQAPMRRFLRSPCLVESHEKLVLVAAVEKSKLNVPKSLRLWGLQDCGTTWVEIERMPLQLYMQFAQLEGGNGFDSVGHGEFIMIIIRGTDKGLLFDICRKRWQWIPACPYLGRDDNNGEEDVELRGLAYEPRLATPVISLLS